MIKKCYMLLRIKLGISGGCRQEYIRSKQNDAVGSSAHIIVRLCTFFRVAITHQEDADA